LVGKGSFGNYLPGLGKIDLGVVKVVLCVLANKSAIGIAELAPKLARDPGPQCARRHDRVLRKDSSGGNDGALANAAIVKDSDAHPNEHFVFNHATVDRRVVPDRDPVADSDRVQMTLSMKNCAILHIRVCADPDGVDVTAEDGVHPNGGVLAKFNVPNDLGRDVDIATGRNARGLPLIAADHTDQRTSAMSLREVSTGAIKSTLLA
jgi:hypothetical protein